MSRDFLSVDAVPIHYSLYESDETPIPLSSSITSDFEETTDLSSSTQSDAIRNVVPEGPSRQSYSSAISNSTNSTSSCTTIPYRSLYYNSPQSSENSQLLSDNEVDEIWTGISIELQFLVPYDVPHRQLWIKIATTLYDKIVCWEIQQEAEYKITSWDFCVIHTDHRIDKEISQEFIMHCELEGLIGTSILNNDVGENCFETVETILRNSEKIFILCSPAFSQRGIHMPCYYDVLLKKVMMSSWKRKLIPLTPSDNHMEQYKQDMPSIRPSSLKWRPFGMANVVGIKLGNRTDIINELRKSALSMKVQEAGDLKRYRKKNCASFLIQYRKKEKVKELGKSLREFFANMARVENSDQLMLTLCNNLESVADISMNDDEENKQVIFMDNCREISIGPAFHFNIIKNEN